MIAYLCRDQVNNRSCITNVLMLHMCSTTASQLFANTLTGILRLANSAQSTFYYKNDQYLVEVMVTRTHLGLFTV